MEVIKIELLWTKWKAEKKYLHSPKFPFLLLPIRLHKMASAQSSVSITTTERALPSLTD